MKEKKESTVYTAVVVAKLEYKGDNIPTKEQLADELGNNIMKWVSQKDFYRISPKESVPELMSVDVDVQ